jgi:hypothetical protein
VLSELVAGLTPPEDLLLERSPLEDIANMRDIAGVLFDGRYYLDRETLDGLQKSVASGARRDRPVRTLAQDPTFRAAEPNHGHCARAPSSASVRSVKRPSRWLVLLTLLACAAVAFAGIVHDDDDQNCLVCKTRAQPLSMQMGAQALEGPPSGTYESLLLESFTLPFVSLRSTSPRAPPA